MLLALAWGDEIAIVDVVGCVALPRHCGEGLTLKRGLREFTR